MGSRIGALALLLSVVTTTGIRINGGMCGRCSCEQINQESHVILKIDCSRLHTSDVEFLLGEGDAGKGSPWKIPLSINAFSDIISIVLDGNSIHRIRPLPQLEFEMRNETVNDRQNSTVNETDEVHNAGNVASTNGQLSNTTVGNNSSKPRLELSFRNNHISRVEPGAFLPVSETLWSLDLSDNDITFDVLSASVFRGKFSEESYEPIPLLEKLNLARNQLHSLDGKLFEHLWKSLRVLNLQGNPLGMTMDTATESALSTLKGLRELNLADTGLSSYPRGLAHVLQSLEYLRLDGNAFTTVPDSFSISKPSLHYLNINRNPIRSINNSSFHSHKLAWSKLKVLDMVAMPELEVVDKEAFEPLKELRILRCCYNRKLSYFHEEAFRKVDGWGLEWERWKDFNLKELELQSNNLEFLSPDIVPWDNLDSANLQSNPWACNCSLKPLADVLRIYMIKKDPSLSVGLHCASPPLFQRMSILNIYPSDDEPNASANNIWSNCGESGPRLFWRRRGAIVSALAAVCVAALVSLAVVVLLVVLVRRSIRLESINMPGSVRYVRAPPSFAEDDDEHVIMDMRWATRDGAAAKGAPGTTPNQRWPSLW
ncbi:hypothetical protein J437_LFUL007726 [Ladona fulva]|uniref:LRRCT domain-containing protein n=1 Tax=Ladona fulva TaxID=123851 RepID=A0A8K0P076_LADFU|nr:hypothetical protein J437_LFUL007726 [Ladona fulva]